MVKRHEMKDMIQLVSKGSQIKTLVKILVLSLLSET